MKGNVMERHTEHSESEQTIWLVAHYSVGHFGLIQTIMIGLVL